MSTVIVPRKEPLPPYQLAICARLREFRESTHIPRTAFAATAGIVGKRLENCELGITPLTYGIFRAVNERFFVRPTWLITGEGKPADDRPFSQFIDLPKIKPKELLSIAWMRDIVPLLEKGFVGYSAEFAFLFAWQADLIAMQKKFADPHMLSGLPPDRFIVADAVRKDIIASLETVKKHGARIAQLLEYSMEV